MYQDVREEKFPASDDIPSISATTSPDGNLSPVTSAPGVEYTSGSGGGMAVAPSIPIPDLNRAIVFGAEFSPEAQDIMRGKILSLEGELKSNPSLFSGWLALGIYRKQTGDYEGARQAWEYVGALQPENNVSFLNLGILYHSYLKDFPKAEQYFLTSLGKNPLFVQTYAELGDLYRYSYKTNTSAAVDVLKQGIEKTENVSLMIQLAKYYQEVKNDSVNARVYLSQALNAAKTSGNIALATALQAEIDALK